MSSEAIKNLENKLKNQRDKVVSAPLPFKLSAAEVLMDCLIDEILNLHRKIEEISSNG